jgi:hypothetical protein
MAADNGYVRAVDNIEKVLKHFTQDTDAEYQATLAFNVFLLKMQPQYTGIKSKPPKGKV